MLTTSNNGMLKYWDHIFPHSDALGVMHCTAATLLADWIIFRPILGSRSDCLEMSQTVVIFSLQSFLYFIGQEGVLEQNQQLSNSDLKAANTVWKHGGEDTLPTNNLFIILRDSSFILQWVRRWMRSCLHSTRLAEHSRVCSGVLHVGCNSSKEIL